MFLLHDFFFLVTGPIFLLFVIFDRILRHVNVTLLSGFWYLLLKIVGLYFGRQLSYLQFSLTLLRLAFLVQVCSGFTQYSLALILLESLVNALLVQWHFSTTTGWNLDDSQPYVSSGNCSAYSSLLVVLSLVVALCLVSWCLTTHILPRTHGATYAEFWSSLFVTSLWYFALKTKLS